MVATGRLPAKFLTVESEHSAMAACVGAAAAGARTYTATSGQGLALMHEMLHWAVGARLPIVLSNVTRAMAPRLVDLERADRLPLPARRRLDDAVRRERAGGPGLRHLALPGGGAGVPAGHGGHGRLHPVAHLGAAHRARPGAGRRLPAPVPAALRPRPGRAPGLRRPGESGPLLRDPLQDVRAHGAGRAAAGRGRGGVRRGARLPLRPGGALPARRRRLRAGLGGGDDLQRPLRRAPAAGAGDQGGPAAPGGLPPLPLRGGAPLPGGPGQGGGARPQHEPGPLRHLRPGDPLRPVPRGAAHRRVRVRPGHRGPGHPGGDGASRWSEDLHGPGAAGALPVRGGQGPAHRAGPPRGRDPSPGAAARRRRRR